MERQSFTRFWIIVLSAVLLVALILASWVISLWVTETASLERYNQQQLSAVISAANGIEGLFDDLAANLGSLATLTGVQNLDEPVVRTELSRKLNELRSLGVVDIGVLDAVGLVRFYAVETGIEGVDYSWREYFKQAQELQPGSEPEIHIIELQPIAPGELGLLIAIPMYRNSASQDHASQTEEFAGVIVGSMTFDTLVQRYIAPFKPGGNGQIYLVNEEYDVVWSSDSDMTWANLLSQDKPIYSILVDRIAVWDVDPVSGGYYSVNSPGSPGGVELVAYAPILVGQESMAVVVRTPGRDARQASLPFFQRQQFVILMSVLTILAGVLVGGWELRREIRRRVQAEDALRESEMQHAVMAERNRLASDLHDSVTQSLYGIVLHAEAAAAQLSEGNAEKAQSFLAEISEAGKEGLAEMRLLIFELRPPVLEEEGLVSALEARLYAVERRAGLKADLRTEIEGRLPVKIEECLYRVAQEALNNALKHAHAEHIRVHLNQSGDVVIMQVVDDGVGFDLSSEVGGMGLSGMRERVEKLGGKLNIESRPGEGTRVIVEVSV